MEITMAANGSALGNPGLAGWAQFVDGNNWSAGDQPQATSNRGESMAVIDFLEVNAVFPEIAMHSLCDSQYVINLMIKWMPGRKRRGQRKADGKPVLNDDLMKRLDALLAGRRMCSERVRGYAGHPTNERADDLARATATVFQAERQPVAGPGLGVSLVSRGTNPDSGADSGDVESGSTGFQPILFQVCFGFNRSGSASVIQIKGGKT